MVIVITGNVVDGLRFYGPFADNAIAESWTEREHGDFDCWVADLEPPEDTDA